MNCLQIPTCENIVLAAHCIMASIKLPRQAGAILLPKSVTFPHGVLPLHIFEPRYRDMIDDAMSSNRMMCVANLRKNESLNLADCTSKIGYIGIIRASAKQDDGCSNLILHCLSRVEFRSWENGKAYPMANIKPLVNTRKEHTEANDITMRSLRDAIARHLSKSPDLLVKKTNEILDRFDKDLDTLTDVIAQQFIDKPNLRQSLLEDLDPVSRAESLIRYLRMRQYII